MNTAAAVAAALAAAVCFALAALLQQESAERISPDRSLSPRLLIELLHRPRWLAGIGFLLAGFGLQALALSYGPVALVQPVVVTELAFAIPLAIWRRRRRAGRQEWVGITGVVGGISLFLWASSPGAGTADSPGGPWLAALIPVAAVAGVCLVLGAASGGRARPMLLGATAGLAFGVLAVITKSAIDLIAIDASRAVTHWQPYAAVGVGIAALIVSQSAYQAGPLAYSMPFIAVLEPVVAVLIGDTVLGEQLQVSGPGLALQAAAAAVAATGIVLLTTSRAVLSIYQEGTPSEADPEGVGGADRRTGADRPLSEPVSEPASQPTGDRTAASRATPATPEGDLSLW